MQAATDRGVQEIAPLFSSSIYTISATLAVTAVVLLLMSIMPRLVTLFFRRLTPDWIDGITTLLLVLLLLGQVTIMLRWLWPDLPFVWPLLLLLTLVSAASLPANPISDGLAYLRLRRARSYQVWDWITVGKQPGQVAAIRPLYTELITTTAERLRLPNSVVLRRGLVVHGKGLPLQDIATAPRSAPATPLTLTAPAEQGQGTAFPIQAPIVASTTNATMPPAAPVGEMEPVALPAAVAQPITVTPPATTPINALTQPLTLGTIPTLRKRQGLGATSIKGLRRD